MVIRSLVGTGLVLLLAVGTAWSADDAFEIKAIKVTGTLRKHEPPITSNRPTTYFVDIKLKGVGVVEQQVDFGGDAKLGEQAAGWVGKRVVAEGRAEYQVVEPASRVGPAKMALVVIITKMSQAEDK